MRLAGYKNIPGNSRLPNVAEYFATQITDAFDCALSGPFDNLFLA